MLDPDGRPISGAELSHRGETVRGTDAAGPFVLPLARASVDLTIRADGYLRVEREARAGEKLEVVLAESRPISGRVVDDRGAPVPLASVMLIPVPDDPGREPDPPYAKTWCDVQGRFTMHPDHSGPTLVVAEAPGHLTQWPPPRVDPGAPVVVHLPRNARLVVRRLAPDLTTPWTVDVSSPLFGPKRVPANERTMWMEVQPGEVECTIRAPGHDPIRTDVLVPPGGTSVVEWP